MGPRVLFQIHKARREKMNGTKSAEIVMGLHNAPVDKIKRYKWKVIDRPGTFCEVPKSDLFVDVQYQRSRWNANKITSMAATWSWVACGTLTVAIRENKWWVIDGATRKLAADRRSDITKLPCMVYDLADSVADEAISFVGINNSKTAVASHDRFKALLVGQDECALGLNALFASTGHKASPHGGTKNISCLMTVWGLYKKNRALMTELWPLISDIHQECQIKETVKGIFWAEIHARKQGASLLRNPYKSLLIKLGGEFINSEVKREVAIVGRGGYRIEANAILKTLNKNKPRGAKRLDVIE